VNATKFSEKIIINRPQQEVFDYTQDYDQRLSWDTFLKSAELINGAESAALGVKAWCVAYNGLGMETEYVSFRRPSVTAVKMTQGPFMFSSFLGSWNFKSLEDRQTEVTFLYSYQLRFPVNLFSFLVRPVLIRNVKQRLVDLKKKMENG